MGTVYCQECSHEINDTESKCPFCGASLDWLHTNLSKVENTAHSPQEQNLNVLKGDIKTIKQTASKPDDYLVWSILVTVFCFVPTGIAAIVYSSRVDNAWYRGDKQYACEMAQKAKKYCLISLVVAIVNGFLVGIVLMYG